MKQLEADKVAEADAGILGSGRMLKKGSEKGSEKDSEKKVNQLIRLLSVNPEITTAGISDELEISTRMVEKYISQLKKDGKIARVGGRKTGHWEVLDELMR